MAAHRFFCAAAILALPAGADAVYSGTLEVLIDMEIVENAIMSVRAQTLGGLRAKANIVKWARQGALSATTDASLDERMAWAIVRDLAI